MAVSGEYRWPCDSCGSDLRFAPGQTQLVCLHCGHVQSIPEASAQTNRSALAEHDLSAALRNELPQSALESVRVTSCRSCGAQVEFDGTSFATECPFCASPVVVETDSHLQIRPQALVPFVLTEPQARGEMVKWLGTLWFAPSGLVEYTRKGRTLSGMYVPFWTFDADTRSAYRGQRGIYYYETETVTVNVNGRTERRQQQVRKVRWQPVSGQVGRSFDDMIVMASTSLPRALGDELTPWDLNALVPYRPDFLAGFRAEGYTVSLDDGNATARARMEQIIATDVARDIGGDEQRIEAVQTRYSGETFKHILLPIWMAAYKYNGKSFRFLVNGQTGEVQGERPWSVWKIMFAVLTVAVLVGTVVFLNEAGYIQIDTNY